MFKWMVPSVNRKIIKHYWLWHWAYYIPNKWGGDLLGKLYVKLTQDNTKRTFANDWEYRSNCLNCKYWDDADDECIIYDDTGEVCEDKNAWEEKEVLNG